ncbi:helix-turn-helix domain-containing protein [Flavobacterium franklandianum]|uniref:Helix-turn-helix domain-containing protein n=1 Tax=Flavobacterium franklandianum TaxID=2594430 RepID=A0A553C647_9FLAO|nr:helix-turn-helix domain-containing protein [Flavobacterium franklandianum]TRX15968.1 helix-turn-helix domain-containing protein [Flavobacterium franklandianum]
MNKLFFLPIFINSFLILSGIIGLFTCVLFLIIKKSNLVLNIYFIVPLFFFSSKQIIVGFLLINTNSSFNKLNDTANASILLLPILYTYLKKLTNLDYSFSWKETTKNIFLPISIIIFIELLLFIIPIKSASIKEYLIQLNHLLFASYYAYLSFRLLSKTLWKPEKNRLSIKYELILIQWSKFIYSIVLIGPLKFIYIIFILGNSNSGLYIYYFQIIASLCCILICLKIISSPELLFGMKILEKKINDLKYPEIILDSIWNKTPNRIPNSVQDKKLEKTIKNSFFIYVKEIEHLVFEEDFFLKSNLNIDDLAYKLCIPKNRLNYFFKYHCTISFTDFKNTIRIIEAKKLIDNGFLIKNTLSSLSKRVGFSSYDPFYRSFKGYTGENPLNYMANGIASRDLPIIQKNKFNHKIPN